MKKHLIAAAVAGALAVPAMAQVTVSGTLDVQALNNSKLTLGTGATQTTRKYTGSGGSSADAVDGFSTSQLVFKAEEDLGGGLKATGVFSQRMVNVLGARDRYIDLAGGFGSVRVGRFNPTITAGYLGLSGQASTGNAGEFYNFVTGGSFFAETNATGNAAKSFGEGSYERNDSMLQYTTPAFGGATASVGYLNTKSDRSETDRLGAGETKQLWTTLAYSAGPVSLGLGYAERDSNREAAPAAAASAVTGVGALNALTRRERAGELMWVAGGYDLGMAKVSLSYATREVKEGNGVTAKTAINDAKLTALAVTIPMGAVTLAGHVYQGDDEGATGVATGVDTDGYQVSARYAFSKRTFAYLITGEAKAERNAAASTSTEMKLKQTGIGLVHNF